MADEKPVRISDGPPIVELVDCSSTPEPVQSVPLPQTPDASPVQAAQTATIEQTGADPPPPERWV